MMPEELVTPTPKLTLIIEKIVPLAEVLSVKLLRFALFVTVVSLWLGIFCYRLHGVSATYTGIIVVMSLIPAAIFYLYYVMLQDVLELAAKIPETSASINQSSKKLAHHLKHLKREDIPSFNLIGVGKKVFGLLKLLYSGKETLECYMNIGFLVSPVSLILMSCALLGLAGLTVVFITTVIIAIV